MILFLTSLSPRLISYSKRWNCTMECHKKRKPLSHRIFDPALIPALPLHVRRKNDCLYSTVLVQAHVVSIPSSPAQTIKSRRSRANAANQPTRNYFPSANRRLTNTSMRENSSYTFLSFPFISFLSFFCSFFPTL